LWHKRFVLKCKHVRLQVLSSHLAVLYLIFPHCLCIKRLDRNCFSGEFILVLYCIQVLFLRHLSHQLLYHSEFSAIVTNHRGLMTESRLTPPTMSASYAYKLLNSMRRKLYSRVSTVANVSIFYPSFVMVTTATHVIIIQDRLSEKICI
jgi:hypothetical protein